MGIVLDKTTTRLVWLRDGIPKELREVISLIRLALQKTPIYYQGNKRTKPTTLVTNANLIISNYIGKLSVDFVIGYEQNIKDHFNGVNNNDRIDLLLKITIDGIEWVVVIEFDSGRADQVSKKFVSRIAQVTNENLIYFVYCYPGTKSMSLREVNKYFFYMESISKRLGLAGFVGMAPPKNRGDL
ncbi:hypothetical protein [Acidithiobacillus sp.]|uniref:hypothetical protein n=1 Tax=Acidithiobacillus sp. TaxID=1872118 RepID=UPI002615A3B7|nr:hypothetical protein [Acidithiobacillus sp.]MDD2750510.1 hypothetical protein [Acidithiobacillus sp.]MDD5280097.1 hypothetical protein [Acidithiobacillus sp.]